MKENTMKNHLLAIGLVNLFFLCGMTVHSAEFKYPANNKVLLYAPGYSAFDSDERQDKITDNAIKLFDNAKHFNASITSVKDAAASVDLVKQFGSYGAVIMHTHGWYWDSSTGTGPFPAFRTGTVALNFSGYPNKIDDKYLSDLLFWRLAVSKNPNSVGVYHYVVLPGFVDTYMPPMQDTFMYLGYCSSLHNDTMWEAFKAKGAKVAFGWSRHIFRDTNVKFFSDLMEKMLPNSEQTQPLTAAAALLVG